MTFRRWLTAIALLALCVGLASAQVTIGPSTGSTAGPLVCTATVAVPPQLRSEGLTELIGDIVLQCTGGPNLAPGSTVPTANITVSLGTNVTSRLLGPAVSSTQPSNTSEALLLIDEPGAAVAAPGGVQASCTTGTLSLVGPICGMGPFAPQTLCPNTAIGAAPGGCSEVVGSFTSSVNGATATATTFASSNGTTTGAMYNTFMGLVAGNQVTFNGVPILPPATGGTARVFRLTNIRANVAGLGGGGLPGTTQLLASISISGSTSLPISNPVQVAGFVQSGLSTSVNNTGATNTSGGASAAQCGGGGPTAAVTLQYKENFATAFKTRVAPTASTNGQAAVVQNIPGTIYNSESGFVTNATITNVGLNQTFTAGLADFGTRLKAVFNNIPAGVNIFVSTTNVINSFSGPISAPAGNSTSSFAQLVVNESSPDSNGVAPTQVATQTVASGSNVFNIAQVPVVNNTATAVWEVINTNPAGQETFTFGVWYSFTANPGANSPPPGTATVNMSFAPTPPNAFTASAGALASGTLPIPRFADTSSASNVLTITLCQTVLLFPFVTNQGGFDTGLAIANTTTDPFGTRNQNGSCTMNFYGDSAPPAVNTGNIATGKVYTTLASTAAAGFQGYMIAVCNFQLAHGFAFISDLGARNLAMGYLALVLPTGTGNRNSGNLSSNPGSSSVEGVAH